MQPDPDYLRAQYSSLSDDALLEIDRAELVDVAQKHFDAELTRRGLRQPPPQRPIAEEIPVPPRPPDTDEKPAWLDESAEVYSVEIHPGLAAEDAATSARDVLEARWLILVPRNLYLRAASTLQRDISNQEFEAAWRTQLEALSDAELLAARPEFIFCGLFDRIERAARVYDREIARRGLRAPASR